MNTVSVNRVRQTVVVTENGNQTVVVAEGGRVNVVLNTPGPQGSPGPQGAAGPQGASGPQGATGPAGIGLPVGGTTDQLLAKKSNTNYDTQWVTPSLNTLSDVNTTAAVDNSVLYYDSVAAEWKGNDINTVISITDGGNF
jgi:hypothetical protein